MQHYRGHRRIWIVGVGLLAAGALLPVPWRQSRIGAVQSRPGTGAVRKAPVGDRLGANPGRKGETYYALEAGATRVTSRFADALAVTERTFDGDLHTTLTDASANEIGRLKFDRVDGVNDIVRYAPRTGTAVQVFNDPGARPTLHGNARQAYSLWKDQADGNQAFEWQDGLMRRAGGARRDVERETLEVHTEFSNGLTAKTFRRRVKDHGVIPGKSLSGEVLVTRLSRDGAEAGIVNWFPESRTLVWNLPGLTKGYIAPEHLQEYGGWPFTPDMEWLNIQIAAFHQFKTQINKNGFVARRQPGWSDRFMQFFTPTLSANEPGCDGLHWLDGTVYRFCCDVHDMCYAKVGCTIKSWWKFWDSWQCDYCNMWVAECFMVGGGSWDDRQIVR
ncbi:MAG TPA: hypothetical protein VH497_15410 [Vicinamibacterales bacterium]|jgi:hypothetical protein